jgi:hypothetical protein
MIDSTALRLDAEGTRPVIVTEVPGTSRVM